MLDKFKLMDSNARTIYFIGLSEKVTPSLKGSKYFAYVRKALDKCWEWVVYKNIKSDDLYWYLENIEDKGIITLMQFEKDEEQLKAWICIADALAYTIRCAYQYQKDKYLPETIEAVDEEETLQEFNANFEALIDNAVDIEKKLLEHLSEHFSAANKNKLLREEVLKVLHA